MFTGIVTAVAEVTGVRQSGGNLAVAVRKPARWKVRTGESVAVNGICSTVTLSRGGVMRFEYMPETVRKTTAGLPEQIRRGRICSGAWRAGAKINLERSLRFGDTLDGHLVTGHVDGVGTIARIEKEKGSRIYRILAPRALLRSIVTKGSVAVDGVSLTVVTAEKDYFTVALTPYTLLHTNLQERKVGDRVNIETDILAKYAKKLSRRASEVKG